MYEPRDILVQAMELLQDEQNDNLPEGQLRLQIKETLNQLENFMKTLGCEDIWKFKKMVGFFFKNFYNLSSSLFVYHKNKPKYICSPTQFILSINLSFLKSVEAFAYNIEIQSGGLCANYWKAFYALFQSFLIKNWCI